MERTSTSAETRHADLSLQVLRIVGMVIFVGAAAALIWGTVFGGVNVGPMRSLIRTIPFEDKGAHFLIYGTLTFALSLILQRPAFAFYGAVLLTGLGVVEEFRQRFVSGRTFEVADMLANGIGAAVGLAVALALLGAIGHRAKEFDPQASLAGRPPTQKLDVI